MTEEHKRKIRESNLSHPERHMQWKGKKHTIETKKKMSLAKKGKYTGEKSSRWKGGISPQYKYKDLLVNKPEKCEVCGRIGRICFDHDHNTGKFRGWLCNQCNFILGLANDDYKILSSLIKYIKKFNK